MKDPSVSIECSECGKTLEVLDVEVYNHNQSSVIRINKNCGCYKTLEEAAEEEIKELIEGLEDHKKVLKNLNEVFAALGIIWDYLNPEEWREVKKTIKESPLNKVFEKGYFYDNVMEKLLESFAIKSAISEKIEKVRQEHLLTSLERVIKKGKNS